jgi:octaheme c-type cytochrome (tetrathionate reductase family)
MWLKLGCIVGCVLLVTSAVLGHVLWTESSRGQPWAHVPRPAPHTDHGQLITGELDSGQAVTRACLNCHPDAARQVMQTSHWTWAGQKVKLPGQDACMQVGKINLLNNFCIHAGPNIEKCSSCHVGYGWRDNTFDFTSEKSQENVDCLACHEQTGSYVKGNAGNPEKGVDLVAVAKSVARPTRKNCGECHFKGGGGDAVKHGDLDGSMFFPKQRIDVHMGKAGLECVDCHKTQDHRIPGCGMSASIDQLVRVNCTDCHQEKPHHDQRLDAHTHSVACQTCHIPRMAIDAPTKVWWDWSEAGQDRPNADPHEYLKIKGSFKYAQNVRPEYYWYNGKAYRYLTGERVDPNKVVLINKPLGGAGDPEAKIWPFKVHPGKQIYDKVNLYLLTPRTWGPGGYWSDFDWDKACRLGADTTGLNYSGQYGWVETAMYWPLSHMVQTKEKALQCVECHGDRGVMNWRALGYEGDPAYRGGRQRTELLPVSEGASR